MQRECNCSVINMSDNETEAEDEFDVDPEVYAERIRAWLRSFPGLFGTPSDLFEAVLLGDVERTRRLLREEPRCDPNDSWGAHGPVIFYACGAGCPGKSDGDYAGCVAELIRAGANVNVVNPKTGKTPLHYIHYLHSDAPAIAKLLVDAGANVNARTFDEPGRYTLLSIQTGRPVVVSPRRGNTVLWDLPPNYPPRMLKASRRAAPILLRAGAPLDAPINGWPGNRRPPEITPPPGTFHDPYLQRVHDTGGFKAYEKQHLLAVTAMYEPKFPQLPKEVVRHLMTFCFHVGYY